MIVAAVMAVPTTTVLLAAWVIEGARLRSRVKVWVVCLTVALTVAVALKVMVWGPACDVGGLPART